MKVWKERLLAFVLFIVGMAIVGWLLTELIFDTPEWVSDIVTYITFGGFGILVIAALATSRRR